MADPGVTDYEPTFGPKPVITTAEVERLANRERQPACQEVGPPVGTLRPVCEKPPGHSGDHLAYLWKARLPATWSQDGGPVIVNGLIQYPNGGWGKA